jgi:hypothetical protein
MGKHIFLSNGFYVNKLWSEASRFLILSTTIFYLKWEDLQHIVKKGKKSFQKFVKNVLLLKTVVELREEEKTFSFEKKKRIVR